MTTTASQILDLLSAHFDLDAYPLGYVVASVKSRGCAECGACADILHFDHIDPATKYRTRNGRTVNPADMMKSGASASGMRYSRATIMAEIRKCRVLCGTCHDEHSAHQRG